MPSASSKAARLLQIEALLLAHPRGMTQAEIARRLGVHRSTVSRYVPDLPKHIYIDDLDGGRWKVDRSAYLVNLRLNLHEAMAVHLAARLLATRGDKHNPHAAAALRKLGLALEKVAPRVSRHLGHSADVMDGAAQRQDPAYLGVLEALTLAWAEGRKARVWHRHEASGRVFEYTFAPYFIEPYAVGRTAHALGYREPPGALRTFKLERIERAELLREPYTIPRDFDPRELLSDAWGIWYTEAEPREVVLRFHPRVAGRVKETRWHPSERTEEQEDGYLIWRARVAETREMLPWIRGWGADVEVLEPEELRQRLIGEARRLARIYDTGAEKPSAPRYYAHSKEHTDETEWQLLKDHLIATGELADELGRDASVSELARVAGVLHDIGKYSQAFQDRLRGSKRRVDHATAGAKEIVALFPNPPQQGFAELLSYCIAGHHTGLPDYGSHTDMPSDGTLLARREKKRVEDYRAYRTEIDSGMLQFDPAHLKVNRENPGFSISFLTRMVFSILVDADWLETERFMRDEVPPRGQYADIEELCAQFNSHLRRFDNPQSELNRRRNQTLQACIDGADREPGFFTLTVPTGGGKTLASMAFALNHALKHGKRRIIYVIPFTSIIEQNAAVFREALGPLAQDSLLEHHSNFDWQALRHASDDETNTLRQKLRLSAENWDIPIVVTTNVQFFESLFASKKSQARKVHNIANSVVIFDEVQMLPRGYLKPCLLAVYELVRNYRASVVFSTATQPVLGQLFPQGTAFTELAPDPLGLFEFYRRVHVKDMGVMADEALVRRLNSNDQALCIVNTRRHAKGLFDALEGDGCFHLSTLMCPAHRKKTLGTIRERLKSGGACRVVSTQVMEAGIDVDFPVGYRALAGLDSIIQAAGRVNREMRQSTADIFVFDPKTDFIKRTPTFIKQTASVAESILRDYGNDPTGIAAIEAYYELLYTLQDKGAFDIKGILPYLDRGSRGLDFEFKTAAEHFKLIDDTTVPVIIPYDGEARHLIEELKYTSYPASTLRKLQLYTVNIYEREFEALQSEGVIRTIGDLYHSLYESCMETYYDDDTGLMLPEGRGGQAVFFD